MAILHPDEIRDMTPAERETELEELETELLNAKAVKAAGGAPENPGRIGELRRTIARIKTIQREEGEFGDEDAGDEPEEAGA
jgi:large subunit ribosomal protein L29